MRISFFYKIAIAVLASISFQQVRAVYNDSSYIQVKSYDCNAELLQLDMISRTFNGVFFVQTKDSIMSIDDVHRDGIFSILLHVPSKLFRDEIYLIWSPFDGAPVRTKVARQSCHDNPHITLTDNKCTIYANENSAWSIARHLGELNGYTIYQNMYGLLVSNSKAFKNNDLNILLSQDLKCPSQAILISIKNDDAIELFKDLIKK